MGSMLWHAVKYEARDLAYKCFTYFFPASNAVPSAISSSSTAAPSAGEMDESQASNGNETVIFNAVTDSDKTDDVHCDSVNVVDDDVNNESLRQPVHDAAPCTEANDPTLTTLSSADEKN